MQELLLDEDSTSPQLNRLKEARPNKINFLNFINPLFCSLENDNATNFKYQYPLTKKGKM